ncbi:MAG: tetratricopeptide repeat protein [Proteobacteria bacterium]|nr:tetratricopeptide repeat protein [Pseudomonadota bacterium]
MPCVRIRILIVALLLALAQGVLADSADDWLAGQQAFQNGDFSTALGVFQRARDAGLEGPAVHYNIAVCHFELENFEQAGRSFQLIADRFPLMRGLAEYNLGLVARRLGNATAAREHFLRV